MGNNIDIVRKRIYNILETNEFDLSIEYLLMIHKFLFDDILTNAGEFRSYNVTKKEYILNGDSVIYSDFHNILTYLTFDINEERNKKYYTFSSDKSFKNITLFTSNIWQTHPFGDGNTRTVSIFIQKYLKSLNYPVKNQFFAEYYEYFRNALVKSCYYNHELGIKSDMLPLIAFFKKALIDENIILDYNLLCIEQLFNNDCKVKKLIN